MGSSNQLHSKRNGHNVMRFIGQQTRLRPVQVDDLLKLEAWDADPEMIALMGEKYADQSANDWLRSVQSNPRCHALVIETLSGVLIGEVELAHVNWREGSAEVRICIGEKEYWNHGFGTDAMKGAINLAFERLNLTMVYLRVFQTNLRALRVYERLGFRKVGILQPCDRRNDPAPVVLMRLTKERWAKVCAVQAS